MFMINCRYEFFREYAIERFNRAFKETENYLGMPINSNTLNLIRHIWHSMMCELQDICATIIYEDEYVSFEVESFTVEASGSDSIVNIIPTRYKKLRTTYA